MYPVNDAEPWECDEREQTKVLYPFWWGTVCHTICFTIRLLYLKCKRHFLWVNGDLAAKKRLILRCKRDKNLHLTIATNAVESWLHMTPPQSQCNRNVIQFPYLGFCYSNVDGHTIAFCFDLELLYISTTPIRKLTRQVTDQAYLYKHLMTIILLVPSIRVRRHSCLSTLTQRHNNLNMKLVIHPNFAALTTLVRNQWRFQSSDMW